jgi:hypothetical protein
MKKNPSNSISIIYRSFLRNIQIWFAIYKPESTKNYRILRNNEILFWKPEKYYKELQRPYPLTHFPHLACSKQKGLQGLAPSSSSKTKHSSPCHGKCKKNSSLRSSCYLHCSSTLNTGFPKFRFQYQESFVTFIISAIALSPPAIISITFPTKASVSATRYLRFQYSLSASNMVEYSPESITNTFSSTVSSENI